MKNFARTYFALVAFNCLFVSAGQAMVTGSGKIATENRAVSGFHGVKLTATGEVIITQDNTEGLVIEAEDNLLPLIESKVTDKGVLQLGFKSHEDIRQTKKIVFKLSVKTLDALELAGSGNMRCDGLNADHLVVKLPGSGDVDVEKLTTSTVAVSLEGSGHVKLAGKATKQTVEVEGSGGYEGSGLQTNTATVSISGSGDCKVSASDTLVVDISGSGTVGYTGKPTITKKISGSGEVHSL